MTSTADVIFQTNESPRIWYVIVNQDLCCSVHCKLCRIL